jgi:phosphoribosylanthranilate isomerase
MVQVKICGVTTPAIQDAAVAAGAHFIGYVFFGRSPRVLSFPAAAHLGLRLPAHIRSIGLFVDPDDDYLAEALKTCRIDMIQLHGQETPSRVAAIGSRFQRPVVKALQIADPGDLIALGAYQAVADWLLFDAKPPGRAALPGGNGHVFDWALLRNLKTTRPWMLSGGLNAGNIGSALDRLTPDAVDVSSGVEDSPGVKSVEKIRAFVAAVESHG